ncbi:uncharacterized protein LOC128996497 [Macrosteles quadrilineatus]|uniref:uncharacterized protein LOC128996497 n=1 Tax=Macrosteles quadrilineatus TaxID=74068 RepID=UPI0023E09053|nr:uncharacterized protein LOC128996497 [Macrosteles quadrilineatus]
MCASRSTFKMKLIFTVVFGSFLISQSLADILSFSEKETEIKGHVLDFPLQRDEPQFIESWEILPEKIDPENKLKNGGITEKNFQLKPGKNLLVKCVEGDNEVNAFVYGSEGYFIDRLKLKKSNMVCAQLVDNISVGETFRAEKFRFNIIYKFNVESKHCSFIFIKPKTCGRCYTRVYEITTTLHYHLLRRLKAKYTNCRDNVNKNADNESVELLEWNYYEVTEFHQYGDPVGDPVFTDFKTDQNLKLKCQQYNKIPAEVSTIAVGFIMYKEYIILEKLSLDTCTTGVEGIYINRMKIKSYLEMAEEFKLVFKNKDGNCFKMDIYYFINSITGDVSIRRYAPGRVNCLNDWTSDAALEVEAP